MPGDFGVGSSACDGRIPLFGVECKVRTWVAALHGHARSVRSVGVAPQPFVVVAKHHSEVLEEGTRVVWRDHERWQLSLGKQPLRSTRQRDCVVVVLMQKVEFDPLSTLESFARFHDELPHGDDHHVAATKPTLPKKSFSDVHFDCDA